MVKSSFVVEVTCKSKKKSLLSKELTLFSMFWTFFSDPRKAYADLLV